MLLHPRPQSPHHLSTVDLAITARNLVHNPWIVYALVPALPEIWAHLTVLHMSSFVMSSIQCFFVVLAVFHSMLLPALNDTVRSADLKIFVNTDIIYKQCKN